MIRLWGRATWAQEAIQAPFQGQRQNKQEMQGNQRALQCLLSESTLHIYFDIHIHIHTGNPFAGKKRLGRHEWASVNYLMFMWLPVVHLEKNNRRDFHRSLAWWPSVAPHIQGRLLQQEVLLVGTLTRCSILSSLGCKITQVCCQPFSQKSQMTVNITASSEGELRAEEAKCAATSLGSKYNRSDLSQSMVHTCIYSVVSVCALYPSVHAFYIREPCSDKTIKVSLSSLGSRKYVMCFSIGWMC